MASNNSIKIIAACISIGMLFCASVMAYTISNLDFGSSNKYVSGVTISPRVSGIASDVPTAAPAVSVTGSRFTKAGGFSFSDLSAGDHPFLDTPITISNPGNMSLKLSDEEQDPGSRSPDPVLETSGCMVARWPITPYFPLFQKDCERYAETNDTICAYNCRECRESCDPETGLCVSCVETIIPVICVPKPQSDEPEAPIQRGNSVFYQ